MQFPGKHTFDTIGLHQRFWGIANILSLPLSIVAYFSIFCFRFVENLFFVVVEMLYYVQCCAPISQTDYGYKPDSDNTPSPNQPSVLLFLTTAKKKKKQKYVFI